MNGIPINDNGQYKLPIRQTGCALLYTSIVALWLMLVTDPNRYQVYAVATSTFLINNLSEVLCHQESSKYSRSDLHHILMTIVYAVLIIGLFNEAWAPVTVQLSMVLQFWFGLGFVASSHFFLSNVWWIDMKTLRDPIHGPYLYVFIRRTGLALLQSAVLTAAIEYNAVLVDPVQAFGISCLIWTLGLAAMPLLSIGNVVANHNMNWRPHYLGMVMVAAMATFFILQDVKREPEELND